jgi:hypothetical protein
MRRTLRLMVPEEIWAALTLAGLKTGRSRSALVREFIERGTDEIFQQPSSHPKKTDKRLLRSGRHPAPRPESTPTKTNAAGDNRGAPKSNALDNDSS